MRSWAQESRADYVTGELEECLLNLGEPVPPAAQPAQGLQPGDGPLHEPAEDSQPAAVVRARLGQHRGDPQPARDRPRRFGVVAPVPLRPQPSSAGRASQALPVLRTKRMPVRIVRYSSGFAAREAAPAWGRGRQPRLEPLPQRIADQGFQSVSSFGEGSANPEGAPGVPVDSCFPDALSGLGTNARGCRRPRRGGGPEPGVKPLEDPRWDPPAWAVFGWRSPVRAPATPGASVVPSPRRGSAWEGMGVVASGPGVSPLAQDRRPCRARPSAPQGLPSGRRETGLARHFVRPL